MSYCPLSPCNVAMRHRERERKTRTPRLSAACRALRYRASTKRPSRNCHVSLAPGTWPYLGGTNATSTTRSACRRGKAKWSDGRTTYVRSLPRTCMKARLAAAGTECTIYTSSPVSRVLLRRRACNHIPRNCNFACAATLLALLSSRRALAARLTGLRHVLHSINPDSKFWCAFPLRPALGRKLRFSLASASAFWRRHNRPGNVYSCSNRTRSRTLSDSREAMRAPLHPRLTSDPPPVIEIHDRRLHDP
jgi:hypothetical protein